MLSNVAVIRSRCLSLVQNPGALELHESVGDLLGAPGHDAVQHHRVLGDVHVDRTNGQVALVLVLGLPHVTGVACLCLTHSEPDHSLEAGRDPLQ